MSPRAITLACVSMFAVTGCGATQQHDIQTALEAVQAARDAARASLPDTPTAYGVMQVLEVAMSTYDEVVSADDDGSPDWARYTRWIRLAAKAVTAVIAILDGAGIEIPDIILEASSTLARWLQ